jgi:hypothetical protein
MLQPIFGISHLSTNFETIYLFYEKSPFTYYPAPGLIFC